MVPIITAKIEGKRGKVKGLSGRNSSERYIAEQSSLKHTVLEREDNVSALG